MNRLGSAASAYLKSAAHQPIDWYPWGDDAFEAARAANRPVLLDIGAVWCHWCHVMDRESYEDPAIGRYLNGNFICIKVDRDERPDIDVRYQRAVQALTRQGGWPLTAFLTPDGQVFGGGTYFPPDGKYGRPGLRSVLGGVLDAWHARRDQVEAQAQAIRGAIDANGADTAAPGLSRSQLDDAVAGMRRVFDPVNGGFGAEPKFPYPGALRFLLSRWFDDPSPEIRTVIDRTLEGMARGGIHDQLGGGFHRYSVDAEWIVPHFEKMAYDNAELLRIYCDAYAVWGTPAYRDAAGGIVRWVREVMADPAGGYAASQDADSRPDDDGDYFTWTREEAAAVLTPMEFEAAAAYYDIGTAGEMRHDPARNVLYVTAPIGAIARRIGRETPETERLLASARERLAAVRSARPTPFVDHSRYTNWNAMLASAMLRAGAVLGDIWATEHALTTLRRLRADSPEPDAVPHAPGGVTDLLDDQVQTAAAALDAHEATGDSGWLAWATDIMERVWREYRDPECGGLLDQAAGAGRGLLSLRSRPIEDTPTPSANGVAALVFGRLEELTGDVLWRDRAADLLNTFSARAADLGLHAAAYLLALDWHLAPATHLVVVGGADDPTAGAMHRAALEVYTPRRVVQRVAGDRATLPAALRGMLALGSGPAGFSCRGAACSVPATGEEAWRATLTALRPSVRFEAR